MPHYLGPIPNFEILPKMSVRLDIERACDLNESKGIYSTVRKGHRTKSKSSNGDYCLKVWHRVERSALGTKKFMKLTPGSGT